MTNLEVVFSHRGHREHREKSNLFVETGIQEYSPQYAENAEKKNFLSHVKG